MDILIKRTMMHHNGHVYQLFQTEITIEICSKSLIGAIGLVPFMKYAENS